MKDSKFDETIEDSADTDSGSSSALFPEEDAPPIPVSDTEADPGSPDKPVKCPHCKREIKR